MTKLPARMVRATIPFLIELLLKARRDYEIAKIKVEVLEGLYRHAMKTGDASLADLPKSVSKV